MATKAQLRAVFGSAWHVNAEAIYDLVASDGTGGAAADVTGANGNLTGNLTVGGATALNGNVSIGNAVGDFVAAYGKTPVVQPSGTDQAAVTTATITTLATTAATQTTPWGFATQAQADAIATAANSLITRIGLVDTLLNQIRSDLVTLGWIKGSV